MAAEHNHTDRVENPWKKGSLYHSRYETIMSLEERDVVRSNTSDRAWIVTGTIKNSQIPTALLAPIGFCRSQTPEQPIVVDASSVLLDTVTINKHNACDY
jgi:hypothetical protein